MKMNTPFFYKYYKTIPCLQNSLFYLLLFCTLPFQAISQSDFEIMYTLRDDYGWGAAFGWGNTLPCPEGGVNWEGVVCEESLVISIQNTCGATKLTTAAFPVEIGGFIELTSIEIKDCWTDPANPVMVNNFPASLPTINKIGLSGNIGLTGALADLLPDYPSPGVLGSLGTLDVSNSGLSGPIPSDFLQRRTVLMYLNQCHFSGTLPASAGDALISNLSGNQLEGVLPGSLVNKTSGSTEISYNKLDVVNTPPGNIDNLDPDWRNTQTVPPTDVQATPAGPNSVSVSWTPIGYTWDGGYYEVLASQSPGGPYTSYGTTADTGGKTASGLTVTGLPAGANYIVVRTFTPAHTGDFTGASNQNNRDNPNDLTSVNSEEVSLLVCPGNILYANDDAAGNNDGSSWTDAFNDLQDALALASTCSDVTEIWVAAGTYKPTTATDRSISFSMKNGVAIYGGFPSNCINCTFADRNWAANVTTLSGDIGIVGDNSDNSYHVISNSGLDNTAVLDGFTVTGGNADASSFPDHSGGGMHNQQSSPVVSNCTFSGNSANSRGGGIYNTSSSPSLTNCSFYQNVANTGGAVSNNSGSLVNLTDCTFRQNSATGGFGGAVQNTESSPCSAVNCVFTGNTAVFGGAVSTASSSQLTNCTFQGNNATDSGGGLYSSFNSSPIITNCIFWQNTGNGKSMFNNTATPQIGHTLIEESACPPGTVCGAGVIFGQDPLFVSSADLHLQACSPAINTGDDSAVPSGITTGLDGAPRFYNSGTVDMGAYEFQGLTPAPVASCQNITVQLDATGNAAAAAAAVNNGSTGCGTLAFTINGQPSAAFDCTATGTPQTATLTVTGNNGQQAACNAIVTVEDNIAPTARCKNITIQLNAAGTASITAVQVSDGSNDNCSLLGLNLGRTSFTCSDVGVQTVTLTATDASGNATACTAAVTVEDNVAPTALCQDITIQLGAGGSASLTAGEVDNGSSDACGIGNLALDVMGFTCNELGAQPVTLTVTDVNGNASTCSATVTVRDDDFASCPDPCPNDPDDDLDNDGICGDVDNCPATFNPGQEDLDWDGQGDACAPSFCVNTFASHLNGYVEGLSLSVSVERAVTRRLDLAVSRFCGGSSNSTVIASLNSVISYVQSRSGNGIPSNEASFIISQVQILIGAINAGGVQCCQVNARPSLPGNAGFAAQAERVGLEVFPNPFSGQAAIRFFLPQAEMASLEVFNLQGQRLKVLLSEMMEEGYYEHSWDGTADGGQQLEAGIYLIRLTSGAKGALVKRVSLIK